MKEQKILEEVCEKYGEWLETAGEQAPLLLSRLLCSLLIKERDEKEYYKKRLNQLSQYL